MTAAINLSITMVFACNCSVCGVPIYMPESKYEQTKRKHENNFYCCNGHSQVWLGKTEAEKLREQLEAEQRRTKMERDRREAAERQVSAARGQVTKIKNRVGNGVCPCCKRTFKQLAAHMACKHPEYKNEGAGN